MENALPDSSESPEAALQASQRRQLVTEALGTLTTNQRAIVLMRYRDGQTWREIGKALNVTPAAACQTGKRAIAALKRWLAAHDISSIQSL
jgi:RNA polymerase sigma factor (sigma-70 family)